jgi:hypothetical protein
MIERDLLAARDKWIEEAKTEGEKERRGKTDFLCYSNHDGGCQLQSVLRKDGVYLEDVPEAKRPGFG